jgi:hypothetical protein
MACVLLARVRGTTEFLCATGDGILMLSVMLCVRMLELAALTTAPQMKILYGKGFTHDEIERWKTAVSFPPLSSVKMITVVDCYHTQWTKSVYPDFLQYYPVDETHL